MNHTLRTALVSTLIAFPLVYISYTCSMQYCPPLQTASWSSHVATLIQTSNSLGLQLILVFLLGLLMSLTPCIYPMIPITVGILQAQGSKSMLSNFITALTYTLGLATTFALLGLLAAFSGQVFGSLLTNPYVVLPIVALLAYLGFSMLGLYEMHVPKWMRVSSTQKVKKGSLISVFLFGLISGTIASPCLSPGLIFLLSIVTALANKFLGFLLLFVFGIGISVPLLFIGSFSGSLALLPRAGVWMVEIKRLLGLVMIATCLYFLNSIVPRVALLWIASIISVCIGLFYLYTTTKHDSLFWILTKSTLGILLIGGGVVLSGRAYTALYTQDTQEFPSCWMSSYDQALTKAKQENKLMLIDVGAPCCSICHAIDAKLFTNVTVLQALKELVLLKIDGSDTTNESSVAVLNSYTIIGFPTILVIDPHTQNILKRWSGELYDTPPAEFIAQITALIHH